MFPETEPTTEKVAVGTEGPGKKSMYEEKPFGERTTVRKGTRRRGRYGGYLKEAKELGEEKREFEVEKTKYLEEQKAERLGTQTQAQKDISTQQTQTRKDVEKKTTVVHRQFLKCVRALLGKGSKKGTRNQVSDSRRKVVV